MSEHEFTLIVSGVDPAAGEFEERFFEAGCDDATLMLHRGAVAVCFIREDEDFVHAVISAYQDVSKAGAIVERLEPDFLVSQTEIAARAKLTRAAVSNYASGDRGTGFPAPKARITTKSPLWDWVDVSGWLYRNNLLKMQDVVDARITRALNLALQHDSKRDEGRLSELLSATAREPVAA
ncbi:hypothetical protein AWH62_14770 [Maricaulis sp. W15]|uniref:hypothetical protein n=1 Tax=Maricaulis sp. W15 TaxID=1772333 RepID=UPI000948D77F|nr:hypothetical protein [Maricaulis sp. W15]OLF80759.1 hypothetical protein AWH62_14770 [Maricaulis sp. W15]